MPITTTTILPSAVQINFNYKILNTPVPNYIHSTAASKKSAPKNKGTVTRFKRYFSLAAAMVPLGNTGITPPAQTLNAEFIDAEMRYYGAYMIINEQTVLTNLDPVLNASADSLGDCLRLTEDQLLRNMLAAGAFLLDCGAGLNGDVPTELTARDISDAINTLLISDARTMLPNIDPTDKVSSAAVRSSYFGLCHSRLSRQLEDIPNFLHKDNYASNMGLPSEWGTVKNIRFLLSSAGSINVGASALANDVYNCFIVAKDAYAYINQEGYSAQFIYTPPAFSGPLAMNASAAFKFGSAQVILNDAFLLNLASTLD